MTKIFENIKEKSILKNILKKHKNKKVVVFYPHCDWKMKMHQRPQHVAKALARRGILVFYCTPNASEDEVFGYEEVEKNLYVTNQLEMLKRCIPKYTLGLYANAYGCWKEELQEIQKKGHDILYEYIDDLHEDLANIPEEMLERHYYALGDENIKVLCTAGALYENTKKYRTGNLILSTNGVNYEDFAIKYVPEIPEEIKSIAQDNRKIIGYYGALAKWFDYELIAKIAKERPNYDIILIGIDYDKSLAEYNYFRDFENVFYLGLVPYEELVHYRILL